MNKRFVWWLVSPVDMWTPHNRSPGPMKREKVMWRCERKSRRLLDSKQQSLQGFKGIFQERELLWGKTFREREIGCTRVEDEISSYNFFFIVKFVCPVEASSFVADPCILIVLFYFFFLPAASCVTEKVLGGDVLARHPPAENQWANPAIKWVNQDRIRVNLVSS